MVDACAIIILAIAYMYIYVTGFAKRGLIRAIINI